MPTKIFHNAFGYNNEGWYVCEWEDYEYKNPCPINWLNTKTPEGDAFQKERDEATLLLHEEIIATAKELNLCIMDFDSNPYKNNEKIEMVCFNNEDGKKLTEALIAKGWKKRFIPIDANRACFSAF